MQLQISIYLSITIALLIVPVRGEDTQTRDTFDWSENTYVIWPLKDNAPDQQTAVSQGDWFRVHAMSGKPGVRFVINNVALSGIRTIWLRSVGGGWVAYPSKVNDVTIRRTADTMMNCQVIDQSREAVAFAHKLGMKIYAWFPILEEAHAWPGNSRSRYVDLHPEQMDQTIEGYPAGMPSYYYKQYKDYKLAIAKELITKYAFDGLVLDFERQGAPYRSDKCGYLPKIVSAFKAETGKDPYLLRQDDAEWRRFRAKYVGRFVKDVRDMIDGLNRPVSLVMMYQPDDPLTAHWDAMEWARQGYFDSFALAAHGPVNEGWESPTDKADEIIKEARELEHPTSLIYYSAGPKIENLRARIEKGLQAGFTSIVYFESTHLFWNHRYSIPLSLAMPYDAVIKSPVMDLSNGGRIVVCSAGQWQVRADSVDADSLAKESSGRRKIINLPKLEGKHRLIFTCELPRNASMAGLAVEGWSIDSHGEKKIIHTDSSWEVEGKGLTLSTIGQPGIPPFLFDETPAQGGSK